MKSKTTKQDYLECKRCGINSQTKDRIIPCPRGGCEAIVTGKIVITTTTEIIKLRPANKLVFGGCE